MVGWFNYKLLEPLMPRSIHLANIACIEHINAYLGNFYLERNLFEDSNPKMKLLFYWHFAEEIEHKSVFRLDTWKDCWKFLLKDRALLHTLRNVLAYLKPGFNPSHIDDYALAVAFFAKAENSSHFKELPAP